MPEYTALSALSVLIVLALERWRWRSGLLRTGRYWISIAIVVFFQCLTDGALTRLPVPVVHYDDAQTLGLRIPFDIPVEDFAFGWSMVTATLVRWRLLTRPRPEDPR